MPINATCPHCKQSFMVPDSAAGKRFKCRNCGQPMDVPASGAAPVAVAAAEDDDEDTGIDVDDDDDEDAGDDDEAADEDEDDDDDEDEGDAGAKAEDKAEEKTEEPAGEKKLSARERLKLKREGKDKQGKDAAQDEPKAESKAASKLAAFAGSSQGVDLAAAGDPGAAFSDSMRAIQRAISPSRLVLSMGGIAAAVFVMVVLGWLFAELMMATEQSWMRFLIYGSMIIGAAGVLFTASAVARVDLAHLRGEEAPGPVKALLKAWAGWIPGLVPSLIIGVAAWLLMFQVEYWIGKATGIAYLGPILVLPLGLLFFVINTAVLIFAPLSLWIAIPVGACGGVNPVGPLLETLGRMRKEPGRIFLSYIVFALLVALIFGVITWVLFMAAGIAGSNMSGFSLTGSLMGSGSMGGGGEGPNFFERMLGALFGGGLAALLSGFIIGPFLSAFVCGGCQEVHGHPYGDGE